MKTFTVLINSAAIVGTRENCLLNRQLLSSFWSFLPEDHRSPHQDTVQHRMFYAWAQRV